jgi:hypothetical protein
MAGERGAALYRAVQDAVNEAARHADYTIVLGHLGISPDCADYMSTDVIAHTTNFVALVDGHSHSEYTGSRVRNAAGKDVILTQSGSYLGLLGCLVFEDGQCVMAGTIYTRGEKDAKVARLEKNLADAVERQLGAKIARAPLLEPADSQEAYDMTRAAFELSEKFRVPVIIRLTTRTSYSSSLVNLGAFKPQPRPLIKYEKDIRRTIPVPMFARGHRVAAEERTLAMEMESSGSPFNRIVPGKKTLGIVTSAVAYQYVREIFPEYTVLKLGWTNPLPRTLIKKFARSVKHLVVVEELDPFLED